MLDLSGFPRKFFTVWPPKSTQVKWRPLTCHNSLWNTGCVCLEMSFLCELCVLARKFASLFDHPTQVQLAVICDYFISWNFSFANLPWCIINCYQFELIKQLSVSTFKIWIALKMKFLWSKNKHELSQLHTCGWGIIKTVLAVDWISSCVTAIFLGWPVWGPSKCNQGRTGNYKPYII